MRPLDQKIGLTSSISTATTASHKTWLYSYNNSTRALEFLDSWLHIQPLSRSISSSNKLGSGHLIHRCGFDTKNKRKESRWYCWARPEDIEWKRRHVFQQHHQRDAQIARLPALARQLVLDNNWEDWTLSYSETIQLVPPRLNQPKQINTTK